MAQIKAFSALRYNPEKTGGFKEVCCPPYDIISPEEQDALFAKSEFNAIRLELPRGEDRYAEAAKTLRKWISEGVLRRDDREALYIYEQEFTLRNVSVKKIKGIVCLVKLEEFSKGVVLPHEETLSKAKADRFNLMSATYCNFSLIYSIYLDEGKGIKRLVDRMSENDPQVEFTSSDGVVQRLWIADDPDDIKRVTSKFADKQLFIADGHHRYETALNFKKKLIEEGHIKDESHPGNYVMMMLVSMDDEGLVVFPTHRLVRDLDSFDEASVLEKVEEYFSVEKVFDLNDIESQLKKGIDKKTFGFYTGKDFYYKLTLKDESVMTRMLPDVSPVYAGLDVVVLHSLILEGIFGIDKENMAKQVNLTYTRDEKEALASVKDGKSNCCFLLNPTKVHEIKGVSLAGEKMPQKSTYFYPKMITGLMFNQIMEIPE